MIAENIRGHLKREPFGPFRLVLSSGDRYDIVNPELVVPMKSEIFVALPDGEHFVLVPYLRVSAVQTVANGRRRSSRKKPGK